MSGLRPSSLPASPERRAEKDDVCRAVLTWARARPEVVAVGLAGSWARGVARMDSDLDIVVLTEAAESVVGEDAWMSQATGRPASLIRTRQWGVLTERRVRLASGFEVEFGFASPDWAAEPVDEGTARVVADGIQVLHDPQQVLERLVHSVTEAAGAGGPAGPPARADGASRGSAPSSS